MIRFDELTGGAKDTLFALFFRGALPSGDLPAKSGAAELRERGLAESGNTAMAYQGENYFTWLTIAGLKFCVEHFVTPRSCAMDISYMFNAPPDDTVSSHEGHLCGNTIEQETLSAVLVHFLPTTNLDKAREHAVKLASAVKASFNELNATTSHVITDQNGAKRVAVGPLSSGDKSDTASGRLSSNWFIKTTGGIQTLECRNFVAGMNPADKPDSTVKVKLELDTSEAMKSLDELGTMAKKIDAIVAEALQQNGSIFRAIKQRERDAASLDDLSARVSHLQSRVDALISDLNRLESSLISFQRTR